MKHSSKIKFCINSVNGECPYKFRCWYKHEHQNQDVFNKTLDMMEKFTHRVVTIENNLKN